MAKNSNKKIIRNALALCVLAGESDVQKREREVVLETLDGLAEEFTNFLIVFKPNPGRFDFKALYGSDGQGMVKVFGNGPDQLDESQIEKFFKYSSGAKQFNELSTQKGLTPTTDAVMLKKARDLKMYK
jgi:hypothetical protein